MTPLESGSAEETERGFGINRRTVLKSTAVAVAGAGLLSGTASASTFQFFGCSQACAGTDGDHAVVWTDSGWEFPQFDKDDESQLTDRKNITWSGSVACIELEGGEAMVGVLKNLEDPDRYEFCMNPNRCAQNYFTSLQDIEDDFGEPISHASECRVFDSNDGPGQGPKNKANNR